MRERAVRTEGIEIATESFGDPAAPPVLLIMGAMGSMLWWPERFCELLAERGRFVIRYDNRDTGLSTAYEPGAPGYTFDDMAGDAVKVLDGYGLDATHLVGMSMGGMIAQLVALESPRRIRTLTAIATSPVGEETSELPPTKSEYLKHATEFDRTDWSDPTDVMRMMVEDARQLTGTGRSFDEEGIRRLIERDVARARNFASARNHLLLHGGEAWRGRLCEIEVPVLVIHGTDDPIFPIPHAAALARAVGGAKVVRLEGAGHELNPADWDMVVDAIAAHTASGAEGRGQRPANEATANQESR